jgi:hypothetical protein
MREFYLQGWGMTPKEKRKRKKTMKKKKNMQMVKIMRSLAIRVALEHGLTDAKSIRNAMHRATNGVKKKSVAGVKAAVTRGD